MSNVESGDNVTREEMEAARIEVMECEKKIREVKETIKKVSKDEHTDSKNSLKISALKVSGLPEAAKPSFKIQISSPIEELHLTKLYDPLDPDGSTAIVSDVDASVATITVTSVHDADIYLGSSVESYDVAPLCVYDPLASTEHKKVTQLDIAIIADDVQTPEKVNASTPTKEEDPKVEKKVENLEDSGVVVEANEEKIESDVEKSDQIETLEGNTDKTQSTEEVKESTTSDDTNETKTTEEPESSPIPTTDDANETNTTEEPKTNNKDLSVIVPICVLTLQVEFIPSKKEEKDALYEVLNTAIKQKNEAVEKLRKSAVAMSQSKQTKSDDTSSSLSITSTIGKRNPKPAVKPGFLNKKSSKTKEPNFFIKLYNRSIGPESMFRKLFPITKNYFLFFGAIALFHFKGNEVALPPPV